LFTRDDINDIIFIMSLMNSVVHVPCAFLRWFLRFFSVFLSVLYAMFLSLSILYFVYDDSNIK